MSDEREKIGIDVWMAGTIYVDADTEEEAAQIVTERYAGTRENSFGLDLSKRDILLGDGGDFLSPAVSLYGVCHRSALVPAVDDVAELLSAAKAFNLTSWLSSGVLTSPRCDGLRIHMSIEGADYEATVTVGELRALSAAIAKAEG